MKQFVKTSTRFADLAYQDKIGIIHELSDTPDKYSNLEMFENPETDTQCFVCQDDKYIYVNIRGTEFDNLNDWFTNLDCGKIYLGVGQYHRGFFNDAASIQAELYNYITNADKKKIVVFGGHSQGAAVASCEAVLLMNMIPNSWRIVQVGCPRFVDDTGAKMLEEHAWKIHRIVNNNDIVCRVPTRSMGFRHVDLTHFHYFMEDGSYRMLIEEWELFKDRVNGRLQDLFELGTDGVKDHSSSHYVRLVNSVSQETELA